MRDEFLGTFGLIGGIEALDVALQNIDTIAWGESHLSVAPEIPNWEPRTPSMIKYCSLAPKEGKNDPREGHESELNGVCFHAFRLQAEWFGNHAQPVQF